MKRICYLLVVGFFLFVLLMLYSPLFNIQNISITTLSNFTKEEIENIVEVKTGMNIFQFNINKAKKRLQDNPYFENISIKRKLPNTIVIDMKERIIKGYVPYMGAYLYIDGNGRVLETGNEIDKKTPIFIGLEFDSFKIGEILPAKNMKTFNAVIKLSALIQKYNFGDNEIRVDVSNIYAVHIYIRQIDIMLGELKYCDSKIPIMFAALSEISEDARGTLDLTGNSDSYIFTHLT